MSGFEAFVYAALAGLVISLLDYASLHRVPKIQRPATFTDGPYLVKFFGHPLIGGFLALVLVQTMSTFNPLIAVIVGAGAPSIWRALMRSGVGMLRLFLKELSEPDRIDDS